VHNKLNLTRNRVFYLHARVSTGLPVLEVPDLLQFGLQFGTELALVEQEDFVGAEDDLVFLGHGQHVAVVNAWL
jgi:hypothetical protein